MHGLGRERILEVENGVPAVETDDRGDAVVNARQREVRLRVQVRFASDGDNRRAEALLARMLADVSAVDVELIRRREIVERRVPKLAWIGLAREDVVSALRRHAQRMRPRIELSARDQIRDLKVRWRPVHLQPLNRPGR